MQLRSGKEAAQRVSNFVSQRHQVHAYSVDLTAKQIYSLGPTGTVDFGGADYLAADPRPVPTYHKHSQDQYQWWILSHGAYLIEFNETLELKENEIALLEPHERLLRAGAGHAAVYVRGRMDPLATMITVAAAKLEIRHSARVTTLRLFRLAAASSPPPKPRKAKKKPRVKKSAKKKRKR